MASTKKMINKKQRWELLYDYVIANKTHGDVLTHQEISNIIQVPYYLGGNNGAYGGIVGKANRELTLVSMRMKSIHSQGYRILQPKEYASAMVSQYNRATKALTKGEFISSNTPVNSLTAQELITWTQASQAIVSGRAYLANAALPVATSAPVKLTKKTTI